VWKFKKKKYSRPGQEYYSISNKLKSEGKITTDFEIILSSLTLEEIIGLRLELAANAVNGKLYGLNIWREVPNIARDAVLKYAHSACRTKNEAAAMLGINKNDFRKLLKKYNVKNWFIKD
tara:strand:- start:371 stop:730 length:360 start_codon:yes stop_codon:yes gene_type:complete